MKPLEDGLERMLESGKLPDADTPVGAYLKANPAARQEVADMMEISRLLRENFAVDPSDQAELEPAPGFYARVLARIESQALPPSIWSFFLEPFGARLAYAALALAVLLFAATMIDTSPDEDLLAVQEPVTVFEMAPIPGAFLASDAPGVRWVESTPDADRGTALVELVTYDQ
jgi:hypothetical protein